MSYIKEIEDVHIDITEEGNISYVELTGTVEVDTEEVENFLDGLDDLIQEYQLT